MSGHRLRGRIASLQRRQRAEPGVCPHQPWRISHDPRELADAEPLAASEAAPPCPCGRPRGEIVIHLVEDAEPGKPALGRAEG